MDFDRGMALLNEAGQGAFDVDVRAADQAVIRWADNRESYSVRVRTTPPAPSVLEVDLGRVLSAAVDRGVLYIVPHLTKSLRSKALDDRRVAVAAVEEGAVIFDGREWRRGQSTNPPRAPRGRKPWGRMALLRTLILSSRPRTQTSLSREIGVAQQAVALSLPKLAPLGVARGASGWRAPDADALWDAFMAHYPGPGGLRRRWTAVAPLAAQVDRAMQQARAAGTTAILSGDSAADAQAPFRRPRTATLYADADVDLSARFARIESDDFTFAVVVPADPTVFTTARLWGEPQNGLTDPVITAWEVARSRGADRADAVEHLKQVVMSRRDDLDTKADS